jgi:hypothetical protein
MNRLVWVAAFAVLLSACGSSVKLDEVPVEDKSGTSVSIVDNKAGSRSRTECGHQCGAGQCGFERCDDGDKPDGLFRL